MPAGGEEQAIRKGRGVGEAGGERVRFEMIDREQRLAVHECDRLRGGEADDHAADEAGTGGGGDPVELDKAFSRRAHRLGDDHVERLDVGARSDFRHHAAECGVLRDLREHNIGQDFSRTRLGPLDHRRRGLVAGRLDAEHEHPDSIHYVGAKRHSRFQASSYLLSMKSV